MRRMGIAMTVFWIFGSVSTADDRFAYSDTSVDQGDDPEGCMPPEIKEEMLKDHQGKAIVLRQVCLKQV